jgi:hypothetical protein
MAAVIMPKYKNIQRLFKVISKALFRIDSSLTYERTLEALERLAVVLHNTDTEEDVWYIGENSDTTLDNLIIGAYWFCADYHGGQSSKEYRVLSVLGDVYKPGCTSGPEEDSTERDVYEQLEMLFEGANK